MPGEPPALKNRTRGNAFTRWLAAETAAWQEESTAIAQIGDQYDLFEADIRIARQLANRRGRGRPRSRPLRRRFCRKRRQTGE
jgi:hypothetical protein